MCLRASLNSKSKPLSLNPKPSRTPLAIVAKEGHMEALRLLLRAGAAPQLEDHRSAACIFRLTIKLCYNLIELIES